MNAVLKYASLVKFAHTVFAMPFAMVGFVYGLRYAPLHNPRWPYIVLVQVILCMVFARNAAMGFNRWADRRIDAENPRTAGREIPAGKIPARHALWFVTVNALLFILTAATINRLAAILSPVALSVILVYSYCKRFTPLAHLVLGLSLGIAPVGAFIAAAGHVVFDGHVVVEPFIPRPAGDDLVRGLRHHLRVAGRRIRPSARSAFHPARFRRVRRWASAAACMQ